MSEPYIDEFLYRGRPPGSDEPPAWQLSVGAVMDGPVPGQAQLVASMLNMRQAEDAGWGLPKIIEAINAEALREVEALREQVAGLSAERERLTAENDALKALRAQDAAVVAQVREHAKTLLKARKAKA